jgi:hypothetical protein
MRSEGRELSETVEITLSLCCSFFKSILWFLVYLIGYGCYLCFQNISLNEQKKLFRLFIFLVISFWIDYILEKYFPKFFFIHISEIKNILLYFILCLLIIKNINKNKNILYIKYNNALALLPIFADGIMVKIHLFSDLKIIVFSYLPLYMIILLINKIFLKDYDSSLLLVYNYLIPDFVLEILFVILMRPKIVPDFFDDDLGDMFNENGGDIFRCVLPNFDDRFNINENIDTKIYLNDKNDDKDEIPIIIIGPNDYINSSNNSDNSDFIESDINKYFSSIHIGYYNVNK